MQEERGALIRLLTVEYPRREPAGSQASEVLAKRDGAGTSHFFRRVFWVRIRLG